MPARVVPELPLVSGKGTISLSAGFRLGDQLHVQHDVAELSLSKSDVLPVLGFRVVRDNCRRVCSVSAYVPGRQLAATSREHLRFPMPNAQEQIFAGMLPVRILELHVDVYAEALALDRQEEGRVVAMYDAHRQAA